MKIRGRALLIATFVGFAVQVVISLASNAISWFVIRAPLSTGRFTGLPVGGSLVSGLACLCVVAVDFGVGLLYASLASREGPLTGGDGALGGGAAGAIEGLLTGLLGVVITAILFPMMMSMFSDLSSQYADQARIGAMVGGLIGGGIGVCIAIIRGAVLAAVGGALGASIFKPKAAAPSA
jgi:hypothetical protein